MSTTNIKKNALEYNSVLSLKDFAVFSQIIVYSLIYVTVWDISLAAFYGWQLMLNLIYSSFSVSFINFQAVLVMIPLLVVMVF